MSAHPHIHIGIQSAESVRFRLNGRYCLEETGDIYEGEQTASLLNRKVAFDGKSFGTLTFVPLDYETASFDLYDVCIGIHFHWERNENQRFQGSLRLIADKKNLVAINTILLEDYLQSVISSEMNATSSIELLKAHAVTSRSWLLAQLKKKENIIPSGNDYQSTIITGNEIIRWYDREDHELFDVCADDHCQRYQGITKASTDAVRKAIIETSGEVMKAGSEICDARFSKCCGGITEEFENCWEPKHHSYLESTFCSAQTPEFTGWDEWIMNSPPAFCNSQDKAVLSQVLNDYDRETNNFYRWQVIYTQQELSALVRKKIGIGFGEITDLIPVERGRSGRITRLHITGTKKSMFVGKELEIRKILSETHLYSSAFVVKKLNPDNGIPQQFVLHGAGWGHGVGLCQIGAAMMAEEGRNYREILKHYFKGTTLEIIY